MYSFLCTPRNFRSALDPNASGFPSGIAGIPEEDEDTPVASAIKTDTDERRSDICMSVAMAPFGSLYKDLSSYHLPFATIFH